MAMSSGVHRPMTIGSVMPMAYGAGSFGPSSGHSGMRNNAIITRGATGYSGNDGGYGGGFGLAQKSSSHMASNFQQQ